MFLLMIAWSGCTWAMAIPGGPEGKASLHGKITEKATGAPVPGAQIFLPDLRTGATSAADGTYMINDLPASKVLVKVTMLGYAAITATVDLATEQEKDFALEESVTEMHDVVVTGTSKATELKRDPVPTVMVDRGFLLEHPANNAIAGLARVPGVSVLSTGPNIAKPYIRGLGYNRVLTLFDGVRQEGQQWGDEHGVEVDQFRIDRVEVVKGPASLMYGSDALAGVVDLLPAPPVPVGVVKGSVLTSYHTNNGEAAISAHVDGNAHGNIWGFRYSHKQATNYQDRYDGRVYGTKYNENDANVSLGVNRSWGYSHLDLSLYDDVQEVPDGSRDSTSRAFTKQITEDDAVRPIVSASELSSYTIGALHQRVQHYRAFSANSFQLGAGRLVVNAGFQRSVRREFSHPEMADVAGLYLVLNTATYDLKWHLAAWKDWEPTLGLNGMYQHNDAGRGTEFVIPSYHDLDVGPFLHASRTIGRWDLSAGVRYDVRRFSNDAFFTRTDPATGFEVSAPSGADPDVTRQFDAYQHTFSGVSASGGLAYALNEQWTVKANVARGYRAPNAAEISAKGVHPGTGFEQLGDADLKPEFSLQEDLGLFFSGTHVAARMEVFSNAVSNYVFNEKLQAVAGGDSLFTQGGDDFPVFKFRQTEALLYGGELGLDIHPHPLDWLHFENALSVVLAENRGGGGAAITDSTRYLPLIPPLRLVSELRAGLRRKWGRISGGYVRVGLQYNAAQDRFFAAYGTETFTPAYTLLDAGIGGDLLDRKGRVVCSFAVIGDNLADVAYQSNMDRLKYMDDHPVNPTGRSGIYAMGRNITLRLIVPFTLKQPKAPAQP